MAAAAQDAPPPQPAVADIVVTAGNYRADRSATAARVDAPLQDISLAVSVVPAQLLRDRGTQSVGRALDTASGVQPVVAAPTGYAFLVRGFADSSATLLDGLREDGGLSDAQSIDRVEVLKGSASALYGGGISSGRRQRHQQTPRA